MPDSTSPFRDGDTSFGSFYPKNYVLAFVADAAAADRAADALRAAGFDAADVFVASSDEVLAGEDAIHAREGVGGHLRELWSRLYTDASAATQAMVELARGGASAVFAYAPSDGATTRAADALRPFAPTVLRKYGAFTVTDLD